MMHYRIDNTQDIGGISVSAARKGEEVLVSKKGFVTSNEKKFYAVIDGFYKIFLRRFVELENCNNFLILRHRNKSADIYINDFKIVIAVRSKKDVKKGELVDKNMVADINKLTFPEIKIQKTDAVIFCMRVGWKYSLYYDFTANPLGNGSDELDLNQMYFDLGYVYRFLLFEKEYELVNNNVLYPKMLLDGWFPFIELIGSDYANLSEYYLNQWLDQINEFLKRFDKNRIDNMIKNWWSKKQFLDKKGIIEAGILAYLQGDNSGYINCINTIYPQIEGIMGVEYFKEYGKKPSFPELKRYIRKKAQKKFPSENSLGFPVYFYDYLDKCIFQEFDLAKGKTDLARHSAAHGYAKQEDFTNVKALQALLVLNQIFFYL